MHRICGSLASNGYAVTLVGRVLRSSLPLQPKNYRQKRLRCFFNKGFRFYAEYNIRLAAFLIAKKMDAICAIDLDTILPCLAVSKAKGIKRVYDAHEFFTELKEVRARPRVQRFWTKIERYAVPKFKDGYTVTAGLADEFYRRYRVRYDVIRNLPLLQDTTHEAVRDRTLVYQGAVNEGRGFEVLIPAMKQINFKLIICGDGNFKAQLKALIEKNGVSANVQILGMLLPEELRVMAARASLGIGLAEREGINQYYALPNKFLEYMHAGLPQVAMNFPEYKRINEEYKVAVLVDGLTEDGVAQTINDLMKNEALLEELRQNATKARKVFCWQKEEQILLQFYQRLFS